MKAPFLLPRLRVRSLRVFRSPLVQMLFACVLIAGCSSSEPIPPVFDQAEAMYAEFDELVPSATVKVQGKAVEENENKVRQLDVVFKNGPKLEKDMMLYCSLAYKLARLTRSHLKDPHQYDRIIVVLLTVEGVGHEFITRYEYEYTADYLDSQKEGAVML